MYLTTLTYWRHNESSPLFLSVIRFLENSDSFTGSDLRILRDYFKHWITFPLHKFPNERDKDNLLDLLNNAQNIGDLNVIYGRLLTFGIDPL